MKISFLRTGLALACALTISACGGDKEGNITLAGGVSGVTVAGLVLQNKGGSDLAVAANSSSFVFERALDANVDYDVTIKSVPSNATCEILNGKGKTSPYGLGNSISVVCTLKPRNLKGTVSGAGPDGLEVINGSHRVSIPANATTFTMTVMDSTGKIATGTVGESQPYGLSIFRQPTGKTCTIANGTGTAGTTDVDNIVITCI